MSTVSVIMCTYNNGQFIEEALRSALTQTRLPDQIIVIDDGSTDGTEAIVRGLNAPRIKYVYQTNRGLSAARNKGISIATTDYVTFLDADDRWRPTMLEKQLALMDDDERIVCSFTNFIRFENETGRFLSEQFGYYDLHLVRKRNGPMPNTFVIEGDAFCELIQLGIIPAYTQVTLYRRAAVVDMLFDERLRICEDTEFALRLFMKGKVAYNTEVLAEIRRHDSNSTKDYSMTSVAEVVAFGILETAVPAGPRRSAFADRFIKAQIDAACAYAKRGDAKTAFATYGRSFKTEGSYLRKAKGAARIALTAFSRRRPT